MSEPASSLYRSTTCWCRDRRDLVFMCGSQQHVCWDVIEQKGQQLVPISAWRLSGEDGMQVELWHPDPPAVTVAGRQRLCYVDAPFYRPLSPCLLAQLLHFTLENLKKVAIYISRKI